MWFNTKSFSCFVDIKLSLWAQRKWSKNEWVLQDQKSFYSHPYQISKMGKTSVHWFLLREEPSLLMQNEEKRKWVNFTRAELIFSHPCQVSKMGERFDSSVLEIGDWAVLRAEWIIFLRMKVGSGSQNSISRDGERTTWLVSSNADSEWFAEHVGKALDKLGNVDGMQMRKSRREEFGHVHEIF